MSKSKFKKAAKVFSGVSCMGVGGFVGLVALQHKELKAGLLSLGLSLAGAELLNIVKTENGLKARLLYGGKSYACGLTAIGLYTLSQATDQKILLIPAAGCGSAAAVMAKRAVSSSVRDEIKEEN